MKRFTSLIAIFLLSSLNLPAQTKDQHLNFYFSSGIGPVYSFFEYFNSPFQYTISRKTLGRTFDIEVGHQVNKKISVTLRFSDHKFSKEFNVQDTMRGTNYEYTLIGKLYRHQYYWQLLLNKIFINRNNYSFGAGAGILFVNDGQQFSAQYAGIPNLSNPSASWHEYPNWEFGTPAEIFGERKLNNNVSLGVKAQAFILISVGSFESISLTPYIRARF